MPHKLYSTFNSTDEMIKYFDRIFSIHHKSKKLNKLRAQTFIERELENLKIDMSQFKPRSQKFLCLQSFRFWLQDFSKNLNENKSETINNSTSNVGKIIINWNEQQNVLASVFSQLKSINGKDNKPVIGNSNEQIAQFLIDSFDVFHGSKLKTVKRLLEDKDKLDTIKASRVIKIIRT